MVINIRQFFLLSVGFLFCILGCARDRADVLMPDHVSPPMDVHETADIAKASFEHALMPILTARCALSGCHVADGPHGLDFRTYESFVVGGEHGPAFIPGNAEESKIVGQVVSGSMPPGGPPLSAAEIQLFVDWINQLEAHEGVVEVDHSDEHAIDEEDMDDAHDEHEDDHDEMDEDDAHDEDMDDDHDDMDDDDGHANEDDDNGHADDDDDDHDDDN